MINNGKYTAIARGCRFGVASTGTQQVAVDMEIVDGEHAGERISWIGSFTDKAGELTLESLDHMGWQGSELYELNDLDEGGAAQALPSHCSIVVEQEEYDGKTRAKVKYVNALGSGRMQFKTPLQGDTMRAFSAQMRGAVLARRAKSPVPAKPKQNNGYHPNAPGNGDDIPF